ncbi:hypothetical protein Dsin_021641 [Dipteronia sinensis]|uniref:RanBP2-type domain-containing protein n=1 Tax=Dipteronia sinensis TaxID=43782 RepID=A0AAE0A1C9_9ROSI|nr:hypothetical protein Dsin_021641 [Dipteronia sinensis]
MGGATRFLLLLTPSPLLHHRCPSLLRLSRRLPPSLPSLFHHHHHIHYSPLSLNPTTSSSTKCSRQLHIRASSLSHSPSPRNSHPWPEFQSLLSNLSSSGYFNRTHGGDEYVAAPDLTEDFVYAANACLSFARDRPNLLGMLPRRDVEILVEYGAPFLFRNADDSVTRMKSFLGNNALVTDKANTTDLMRFLLSYASNLSATLVTNNVYHRELVESSVRNLLGELAKLSNITPESNLSGSVQSQFPDRYGQKPGTFGQKIEMKRGDWICSRCSFMNFARNTKCLECEEARPKRQLTGGEWECLQCGFCNYGKNIVCLRCDCKRPGEIPLGSGPGYGNGGNANKVDVNSSVAANEEKAQRWFSKVSQLDSTSDMSSAIADEDFPEIMPLRKGVNRFVVSTRKTPLERRLENAQYRRNLGNDGTPEGNDLRMEAADKTLDMKVRHSLDDILGRSSSSSASRNTENQGEPNSKYVPFVPLPADMFAQKPENVKRDETMQAELDENQYDALNTGEQFRTVYGSNDYHNSGDNLQLVENPVNKDEQAEKSERWFKRVTELNDVTDMAGAISDEDFPETMPMRKGENRFVVNKKKDRSLTTPMYKRQMAMEQTNNTNFVPFPPDYFAKTNKQQPDAADLTAKANGETSKSVMPGKKSDDSRLAVPDMNGVKNFGNRQSSSGSWNLKHTGENLNDMKTGETYGTSTNENSRQNFINQPATSSDNWNSRYSGKEMTNLAGSLPQPTQKQSSGYSGKERTNLDGSSSQPTENQNIRSSWSGKSLEGSAVKESDPLDMSEEAKAERWFRRVAQIKDISELSQIPDEDFPSIMPMRKGVNRFVVSKRKTPLERRLTSQQYRKSLPIVSSDPVKKEQDNS